ncbi:MAG: DUF488 domain-containing protein [Acidobacteria bacterium]|nr:DUF488 domain-containing protein [Acidobacteriota bacterium]
MSIFTVGHSTRPLEDLLDLLRDADVKNLVDVRAFPGSRRFPHFNRDHLADITTQVGIQYHHLKELGGFRRPAARISPNCGWKNDGFRAYADYMATDEFRVGLEKLLTIAAAEGTAIMCAEANPWRCHRQLIADALVGLKKVPVLHILALGKLHEHRLTPFAVVLADRIIYPNPLVLHW